MAKTLWPYEEAGRVLRSCGEAGRIVLETGYGPSGAPHIGTFAEVARTSWVGSALEEIGGKPWTLIAFSDDMDGLRKVPLNMPREALEPHLGKPLSSVPDPFGCHASYAAHNNARLREMLDRFGFLYTFKSSTEQYAGGHFDEGLARIMRRYEEVREIILPTIREEKRAAWSPFFPVCERCGRINGTRVTGRDPERLTVSYVCEGDQGGAVGDEPAGDEEAAPGRSGCGHRAETSILGGRAKVGWKVDWALRWFSLGVHYEMYGKDLIESAALSTRICRLIAGKDGPRGPVQSFYEMFLDEEGRKISKSVGRGLTVDSWLASAPKESLLLFIFKDPRKAKKLSWDVVVRSTDEYLQLLQRGAGAAGDGTGRTELDFIQPDRGRRPRYDYAVSYSMLIGLITAIGVPSPQVVKDYVHQDRGALPESDAALEALAAYAAAYVREQVLPRRVERSLTAAEAALARELAAFLDRDREPEEIQTRAFDLARRAGVDPKEFFRMLYNVLTGQDSGPRLGSFVKLMGQGKVAERLRAAAA
ncbi:MAG TPA: lysine--tRNA ligase [Candidatus Polarisedimenticolia bacterium]|nr:lysine--tRNA ligase [Candidatus Polarisedimenticolia bacterium]